MTGYDPADIGLEQEGTHQGSGEGYEFHLDFLVTCGEAQQSLDMFVIYDEKAHSLGKASGSRPKFITTRESFESISAVCYWYSPGNESSYHCFGSLTKLLTNSLNYSYR